MATGIDATDEEKNTLVQNALDYMGKDISIPLTGQSDVAAGVAGLPASPAPGGMAGFAGGSGSGGQGQQNTSPDKSPMNIDIHGLARKINDILGPPAEQRGETGGTSLSDQVRSGASPSAASASASGFDMSQYVGTPSTYGGAIGAEGGAEGLRGLGQMTPGAGGAPDFSMVNTFGQGGAQNADTINALLEAGFSPDQIQEVFGGLEQALSGGAGGGAATSAASGLGSSLASLGPGAAAALIGALPGILAQTGVITDPVQQAQAQLAATAAAPAAAAGLGVALGTSATGLVGGGVLAAATLPIAIIQGIQAIKDAEIAKKEGAQFQKDMSGPIRELQGFIPKDVPGVYETLSNPNSTTEQMQTAYTRAKYLQDLFNEYDRHIKGGGEVSIGGFGQTGYTKGLEEKLRPFMEMNSAGLLLGQDALTKAGAQFDPFWQTGTRGPESLMGTFMDPQFLQENYYQRPANILKQAGIQWDPVTGQGAPVNLGEYGIRNIAGDWDPAMQADIQSQLQPGNLVGGLQALSQKFGSKLINPYLAQALARQQPGAGGSGIAGQINAMIGAGGGAGTGLAEGLLPEEERRRLSQ